MEDKIENRKAYILGILTLILAGITSFTPKEYKTFEAAQIGLLFSLIGFNAAILIMLGGINNSKNLSGIGLIIGIASWALVTVLLILSIVYTVNTISIIEIHIISLIDSSEPRHLIMLMVNLIDINVYKTDIILDVIHLCILGSCITLGTITFGLIKKFNLETDSHLMKLKGVL